MGPILPTELMLSVSQEWPARDLQIRQLSTLLNPNLPNPSTIILHGPPATGKTSITRSLLSSLSTPHVYLRCAECITVRHLLFKTVSGAVEALGLEDSEDRYARCENVSGLAVALQDLLREAKHRRMETLVIVFDGIDRQREGTAALAPALARLGEIIPSLTIIMILASPPRPMLLQLAGVPHVQFPQYTRREALAVMASFPPPKTDIPPELLTKLYPHFCAAVYDSLARPTSRHLPTFRSTCQKIWPLFIAPVVNQEELPRGAQGEWDFQRLVVRNRALFQVQGENALVDRISGPKNTMSTTTGMQKTITNDLILPFLSTLILTAAYLASYTPPRLDTLFFSRLASTNTLSNRNKKSHFRRRLKAMASAVSTSGAKSGADSNPNTPRKAGRPPKSRDPDAATSTNPLSTATVLTTLIPRPFPLDRLIAIVRAIHPNPASLANPGGSSHVKKLHPLSSLSDTIYAELATLERLRLVVPAGGGSGAGGGMPDLGEKWRVNVSDARWISRAARLVLGIEVAEWGIEGLFA